MAKWNIGKGLEGFSIGISPNPPLWYELVWLLKVFWLVLVQNSQSHYLGAFWYLIAS